MAQVLLASFASEALVVKVDVVDTEDFARALFATPLAVGLAEKLERGLEGAQRQLLLVLSCHS